MHIMIHNLPKPSPDALAHSQSLSALLIESMQAGSLSFADFMDACLYAPGMGYYAAGSTKFGAAGDFVTAPLISSLFGITLAQATHPVILQTQGAYLELGAGNGKLAKDILDWMVSQGDDSTAYYILEVSPDCRERQEQTLAPYLDRVAWLDTVPNHFKGVILANEVLDALPVCLFRYQEGVLLERRVGYEGNHFIWQDNPINNPHLLQAIEDLKLDESLKQDYLSEINPNLPSFVHSLVNALEAGQLIFIDYGFLRDKYYHCDRKMGTLMCHYRHHAHPDPFLYPGLQDITAHVDFSTVGLTAQAAGGEVAMYTQAEFLLHHGLLSALEVAMAQASPLERAQLSSATQKLVDPHEMGELFKVMVIDQSASN